MGMLEASSIRSTSVQLSRKQFGLNISVQQNNIGAFVLRRGRWPDHICSYSNSRQLALRSQILPVSQRQTVIRKCVGGQDDGSNEELERKLADQLKQARERQESQQQGTAIKEKDKDEPPDTKVLQALFAIGEGRIERMAVFGTRNMPHSHQQVVELLSYAAVQADTKIFTSGATGTNAAVVKGVLRADKADQCTVILPQSLSKQPEESQELLLKVGNVIAMPENDSLQLSEASRICNQAIVQEVQQVIIFAYHDSSIMLEAGKYAQSIGKVVTTFFLD